MRRWTVIAGFGLLGILSSSSLFGVGFVPMLSGCNAWIRFPQQDMGAMIAKRIQNGNKQIAIAQIANFEWDKLHIIEPYTSQEQVDRALGFVWKDYEYTGVATADGADLLIFTKNRQVVNSSKLRRNQGDFIQSANGFGYTHGTAVFNIKDSKLTSPNDVKAMTLFARDGLTRGIYNIEAWIHPSKPGKAFVKVIDTRTNQPITSPEISVRPALEQSMEWSQQGKILSQYNAEVTIHKGDWSHQYKARFELWYRTTDGKEAKLMELSRMIYGWER